MRRLQLLSLALVVAAAAFIIAVQRDTFLRRWLVPPRPAPAEMVIPRLSTNGLVSVDDAVAIIGRAAGVRIELDRVALMRQPDGGPLDDSVYIKYKPSDSLKVDIHLDGATVQQALEPVLHTLRSDAVAIVKDGGLLATARHEAVVNSSVVVRTYDLRSLVAYQLSGRTDDEILVKRPAGSGTATSVTVARDIEDWADPFVRRMARRGEFYLLGTTLVVVAPLTLQQEVAEMTRALAEPRPPGWVPPPPPPGPAARRLQERLPSLDLRGVMINDALFAIAEKTRLNARADWKALEAAGIDWNRPTDLDASGMTGAEALAALCRFASTPRSQVDYAAEGSMIVFGYHGYSFLGATRLEAYDVVDLLCREVQRLRAAGPAEQARVAALFSPPPGASPPSLDTLAERSLTAAVSEVRSEVGYVRRSVYQGRLLVKDEATMHQRIARRLEALRASTGPLYAKSPNMAESR
jgi:hypothetical protein